MFPLLVDKFSLTLLYVLSMQASPDDTLSLDFFLGHFFIVTSPCQTVGVGART